MILRWPDPTEGEGRRVLVEGGPPSPANVLNILYTINGGPRRITRGWNTGLNPENGLQIFAANLPEIQPGDVLDWWPALSNGIREFAPEQMSGKPPSAPPLKSPSSQQDAPKDNIPAQFPYALDFLARVSAPLASKPTIIGDTPEGLMIVFPLAGNGTVRGPKLNGEIEHVGGDWMRVRRDGVGISGIRVVVDCDDKGKILGEYGGVVNFGPDGYSALAKGGGPEQAEVQLAPRFVSASPELDWLNRVQCVGLGKVTMSTLLVEYDLYAVRSRAIQIDQGGADA